MARTAVAHILTPTDSIWKKAVKLRTKLKKSITQIFSELIEAEYEKHFN